MTFWNIRLITAGKSVSLLKYQPTDLYEEYFFLHLKEVKMKKRIALVMAAMMAAGSMGTACFADETETEELSLAA